MNAKSWLDDVPSLDTPNPCAVQDISRALLDRLAEDTRLLTQLVDEIPLDAERLANSRVTLLLNRLSLYHAPDRGFEIRMNCTAEAVGCAIVTRPPHR